MKGFIIGTVFLFASIAALGWLKGKKETSSPDMKIGVIEEIDLGTSGKPVAVSPKGKSEEEQIDLIPRLFALDSSKLPIVETVSFTSRVPWLQDRPAWIADYASHYQTSRHFIARGLNQRADYFSQKIHPGDRFNVFSPDKDIQFHLVVDLSQCKMWFYYLDGKDSKEEKVLLKVYPVGVGKKDRYRKSGSLTPLGTYRLGEKIAIYKPGVNGYFQDEKVEMIRIFGTRWLPFSEEVKDCSEPAKGFGIHGSPWIVSSEGILVEDQDKMGKSDSDGCIRMKANDIEELFAIVITKPTTVEIVKEYHP